LENIQCNHNQFQQVFQLKGFLIEVEVLPSDIFNIIIPTLNFPKIEIDFSCSPLFEDLHSFYASLGAFIDDIRLWYPIYYNTRSHFCPMISKGAIDVNQMFSNISENYPEEEIMIKNIIKESKESMNDKRLLIRRHLLESIERLDTWFIYCN
jgi:hypothetical protein